MDLSWFWRGTGGDPEQRAAGWGWKPTSPTSLGWWGEKGLVPELKELIWVLIIPQEESSTTPGWCWDGKQGPAQESSNLQIFVSEIFRTFLLWPLSWVGSVPPSLCSCPQLVTCLAEVTEHCWLLMVEMREITTCFCVFLSFGRAAEISISPWFMDLPFCQMGITLQKVPVPREGTIWWHSGLAESWTASAGPANSLKVGSFWVLFLFFIQTAACNRPETVVTEPLKILQAAWITPEEAGNKRAGIKCIPQCPSLVLTAAV